MTIASIIYPFVYRYMERDIKKLTSKKWKVGFIKTYTWKNCKQYVKDSITKFLNKLESERDIDVEEIDLGLDRDDAVHAAAAKAGFAFKTSSSMDRFAEL